MTKIPLALPVRKPTPAERDELLRGMASGSGRTLAGMGRAELMLIWDLMGPVDREEILCAARRIAERGGLKLPQGEGPPIRTEKK